MFDLAQIIAGQRDPVQAYLQNYLGTSRLAMDEEARKAQIAQAKLMMGLREQQMTMQQEQDRVAAETLAQEKSTKALDKAQSDFESVLDGALSVPEQERPTWLAVRWGEVAGKNGVDTVKYPTPPMDPNAILASRQQKMKQEINKRIAERDKGPTETWTEGRVKYQRVRDADGAERIVTSPVDKPSSGGGGGGGGMGPREFQAYQMYTATYGDRQTGQIRPDAPDFETFLTNPSQFIKGGVGAAKPGSSAGVPRPAKPEDAGKAAEALAKEWSIGSGMYELPSGRQVDHPTAIRFARARITMNQGGGTQQGAPTDAAPGAAAARYVQVAPGTPGAKHGTPPGMPEGWYILQR